MTPNPELYRKTPYVELGIVNTLVCCGSTGCRTVYLPKEHEITIRCKERKMTKGWPKESLYSTIHHVSLLFYSSRRCKSGSRLWTYSARGGGFCPILVLCSRSCRAYLSSSSCRNLLGRCGVLKGRFEYDRPWVTKRAGIVLFGASLDK